MERRIKDLGKVTVSLNDIRRNQSVKLNVATKGLSSVGNQLNDISVKLPSVGKEWNSARRDFSSVGKTLNVNPVIKGFSSVGNEISGATVKLPSVGKEWNNARRNLSSVSKGLNRVVIGKSPLREEIHHITRPATFISKVKQFNGPIKDLE